jgi:hypothetical protein
MRWVASEDCKVKGPGRAVLWVIAYHADHQTGECWVGQRRLARESGFARSTVQRALEELFGDGVLEFIDSGSGPQPDRYQIAPELVEGETGASGVVEGETTVTRLVEGQASASEDIHNPSASGLAAGPLEVVAAEPVDRSSAASGPIGAVWPPRVDSLRNDSGFSQHALSSENASQGLDQGSLDSRDVQVLGGGSTADAAAAEAYEPPPVDEATKAWLRSRGLGPKQPPDEQSGQEQETAS